MITIHEYLLCNYVRAIGIALSFLINYLSVSIS